jgi:hypothetical protein
LAIHLPICGATPPENSCHEWMSAKPAKRCGLLPSCRRHLELLARPRKISPKESRQIIRKVTVTRCPMLVPRLYHNVAFWTNSWGRAGEGCFAIRLAALLGLGILALERKGRKISLGFLNPVILFTRTDEQAHGTRGVYLLFPQQWKRGCRFAIPLNAPCQARAERRHMSIRKIRGSSFWVASTIT